MCLKTHMFAESFHISWKLADAHRPRSSGRNLELTFPLIIAVSNCSNTSATEQANCRSIRHKHISVIYTLPEVLSDSLLAPERPARRPASTGLSVEPTSLPAAFSVKTLGNDYNCDRSRTRDSRGSAYAVKGYIMRSDGTYC